MEKLEKFIEILQMKFVGDLTGFTFILCALLIGLVFGFVFGLGLTTVNSQIMFGIPIICTALAITMVVSSGKAK